MKPICIGCGREPDQIGVYCDFAKVEEITPEEYVIRNEGTYNHETKHFWCDRCYIDNGCPLGVAP